MSGRRWPPETALQWRSARRVEGASAMTRGSRSRRHGSRLGSLAGLLAVCVVLVGGPVAGRERATVWAQSPYEITSIGTDPAARVDRYQVTLGPGASLWDLGFNRLPLVAIEQGDQKVVELIEQSFPERLSRAGPATGASGRQLRPRSAIRDLRLEDGHPPTRTARPRHVRIVCGRSVDHVPARSDRAVPPPPRRVAGEGRRRHPGRAGQRRRRGQEDLRRRSRTSSRCGPSEVLSWSGRRRSPSMSTAATSTTSGPLATVRRGWSQSDRLNQTFQCRPFSRLPDVTWSAEIG